jgi:hypothetical protein
LIHSVIGSIRSPASCKSEDRCSERESSSCLSLSNTHWNIRKLARVSELADNDEKDDEAGDPGVSLVGVNDLVSKEGDQESGGGDDDDSSPSWHIAVDGVEQLSTDNNINSRPTNTGEDVEYSNDLDTIISEEESGQNHLSQAKLGTKSAEEGDRSYTKQIDEKNDQDSIDESKVEDRVSQGADGERRDNHVGREPHGADLRDVCWGSLIAGHSFDTTLFDTEFASKSLCLRIPAVSKDESLGCDSTFIGNIFAALGFVVVDGLLRGYSLDIVLFLGERTHLGNSRSRQTLSAGNGFEIDIYCSREV